MSKLVDYVESVVKPKKEFGICSTTGRLEQLKDQIKFLQAKDCSLDKLWRIKTEKYLLGIALSGSTADVYGDSRITHKCEDIIHADTREKLCLGVDILEVYEYVTKSGQNKGQKPILK